jgi:DNA-binding CsgD family transcriptional regulator
MKHIFNPEILNKMQDLENMLRNIRALGETPQNMQKQNIEHHNVILARLQNLQIQILREINKHIHHKLSLREVEIIFLIVQGKRTDEIAKALNLSKHTVESHRTNIFSKLDVRNVAELVALAFRIGMVV